MAGLPLQLLLLQTVPRGPGFEEVGDVADLAEERRAGADWAGTGQDGAAQGREGQWSPGAEGHSGGGSEDGRGGILGERWEERARVLERQKEGRRAPEGGLWSGQGVGARELTVRPATSAPCRRPTRTSLQWCLWSDTRV